MQISWNQIEVFLKEEHISFRQINSLSESSFRIASLFSPIDQGFYFYNGVKSFPEGIKDSVVLINSEQAINSFNTFIVVENQDVQLIYYKLLSSYFKQRSTGIINSLTEIDSKAQIGQNVQIDSFCSIGNAKIGNNCIIGSNCKIHDHVEIGDNTIIEAGSIIGTQGVAWIWADQNTKIAQPQLGGVSIGKNCFLGANTIVVRGSLNEKSTIEDNVMLSPGCRLGHGTIIKKNAHLANNVITAGNVHIGEGAFIGSGAIFRPKVRIHNNTIIAAGAVVVKNTTAPFKTLIGCPAKETETKETPSGMPKPLHLK